MLNQLVDSLKTSEYTPLVRTDSGEFVVAWIIIIRQHPYMINFDKQRLAFFSLPVVSPEPESEIPQHSKIVIIVVVVLVSVVNLVLIGYTPLSLSLFRKRRGHFNHQMRR